MGSTGISVDPIWTSSRSENENAMNANKVQSVRIRDFYCKFRSVFVSILSTTPKRWLLTVTKM